MFIFYRALKEPMDLLFGAIGKGFKAIGGWISGSSAEKVEVIKYG